MENRIRTKKGNVYNPDKTFKNIVLSANYGGKESVINDFFVAI